ncbi:sodium:proton antiporter [Lujinxingia litoralis]|uniref:Sodium:proton antiporter n=1 Tax=Lujinxingia litoralis TaxID=2211119 RepID=A0A328CEF5_9DELT|nr:MnhB domain-containing protein [Lujinxingia litoralis]RAL25293.1 sodium:proton antiporter [Lujinxingia litoralis]
MRSERAFEVVVGVLCAALGALLGVGAFSARGLEPGAGRLVVARLSESGVSSQVTAVLLNFRAYDTMLEVTVLVVAFWGVWSLRPTTVPLAQRDTDPILRKTMGGMLPVLWLLSLYLLWAGTSRPGGEFAAGAVLGAAGVLSLLMGLRVGGAQRRALRKAVLVAGILVFVAAGLAGALRSGVAWGYGAPEAKRWIVAIEIAGAATIAFVLVGLFAGGLQRMNPRGQAEGS